MSRPPLKRRGDVVAHWVIETLLGAGQEGDVYLVTDLRDGTKRSLKLLRGRDMVEQAAHTAAWYRRFRRIESVKQFREWGVLPRQRGVGERPWLAFDYVAGETLARYVAAGRVREPVAVLARLCEALRPIHRRGLAISDFDRLRNVVVERRTGKLKFCDLDAGVPGESSPPPNEDMAELLWCAAALYRRLKKGVPIAVRRSLAPGRSIDQALAGLQAVVAAGKGTYTPEKRGSSARNGSSRSRGSTCNAMAKR